MGWVKHELESVFKIGRGMRGGYKKGMVGWSVPYVVGVVFVVIRMLAS